MNELTVGSLFAGIGGFDLGLERAGMRTVWFCEQDEFCRAVLAKHWQGVPCYPDVRALVADTGGAGGWPGSGDSGDQAQRGEAGDDAHNGDRSGALPVPVPHVDVLCGGFPCQDLSLAGKGAGIDGQRSGLWGEYARLIRELRPRYVVVENVAALLGRGLGRVLGDLAACGYDAEWDCIPASAVGAPHRRDRLWIVAYPQLGADRTEVDGGEAGRSDAAGPPSGVGGSGASSGAGDVPYPQRGELRPQPGRRDGEDGSSAPLAAVDGEARPVADSSRDAEAGSAPQPGTVGERVGAGGERGGASVADPEGQPVGAGLRESGSGGVGRGRPGDGSGPGEWWQSEPDVRLLADGLSEGVGVDASHRMGSVEGAAGGAEISLRGVWEHVAARAASHGRRPDEQLTRELADALSPLPHDLALEQRQNAVAFASAYVRGLRQACEAIGAVRNASDPLVEAWLALSAEDQAWVDLAVDGGQWAAEWPGVGRVSRGEQNRVDRLAALGNSLVPQIAEWLGRRIIEAEEQLT